MVDGICTNCGHTDGTTEPEPPVEPEEGECTYLAEKSLASGETYVLKLGGTNVGSYTFTQVSGGWAIRTENGRYLALSGSSLTNASEPFAWTYSGGSFSTTTTSSGPSDNNGFGGWFGNWWGSGSSSSKTTY